MITNQQRTTTAAPQRPRPEQRPRGWKAGKKEADYNRRQSRSKFVFIALALVAAIGVGIATRQALTIYATGQALIYQNTVIATQTIPVGTAIMPGMFKVSSVPTKYRPANAAQSPAEVEGRIAFYTIPADVPITLDALSDKGAPESVSGQLPKSAVGFFLPDGALLEPVPLSLVNPGDYVDVYVAGFGSRAQASTNPDLNPVLSCVRVLDVVGTGQAVPQNVISPASANTSSTPGFVMVMSSDQVSAVLYFVQSGSKLAVTIDRYDACTGH